MVDLQLTADGGVALEWRVLVGESVCSVGWCTFQTAFVDLCVGVQLPVGTRAGRVWSRGAAVRSVGVAGWAWAVWPPQAEPPVGVAPRSA